MTGTIGTIAIDLTPLLPGGENGGAKIFVLDLLRELFDLAPATRFVLLTQARTHAELASLDRANVRRVLVLDTTAENVVRPSLRNLAARVFPRLPRRLRVAAGIVAYKVNNLVKRGASHSIVRQVGADLLFCPFTAPIYFEPGVPTVCTIYDLQYRVHPDFFSPEVVANRARTFVDACRKATMLAAISDYSRYSVIEHSSFDPEKIRTIHLRMAARVVPDEPDHGDDPIHARLGLVAGRYVIYPANFWLHKNHEMLITAFGMACSQGLADDVKLVCTGAPGERQVWLEEAVRRLGLAARVVFPGFVAQDDLSTLLGRSAGMVFPSLFEGFGLPVIEAMAARVPVACSDNTSLREVAADAALFFDARIPSQIAAAIVALTSDAALRARLVAAGVERAVEFSDSRRMASEYWDLFERALSTARPVLDAVSGIYPDGWAGREIALQVASGARTLDLEFFAPEWLPMRDPRIRAKCAGRRLASFVALRRGGDAPWSLELDGKAARIDLAIDPTFVPSLLGIGADTRELSVMVRRCSVTRMDGSRIDLLAEQAGA